MTAILYVVVTMSLLVALLILYFKPYDYGASATRFRKIGDSDDARETSADTNWRSVKIRPGLIACDHVAKLTDQVFNSKKVPTLPLASCSEADCRCHYTFHDDRRSGMDRRVDVGRFGTFLSASGENRRHSIGRRKSDLATA